MIVFELFDVKEAHDRNLDSARIVKIAFEAAEWETESPGRWLRRRREEAWRASHRVVSMHANRSSQFRDFDGLAIGR